MPVAAGVVRDGGILNGLVITLEDGLRLTTWALLNNPAEGKNQLPKVVDGVKFADNIEVVPTKESHAA